MFFKEPLTECFFVEPKMDLLFKFLLHLCTEDVYSASYTQQWEHGF